MQHVLVLVVSGAAVVLVGIFGVLLARRPRRAGAEQHVVVPRSLVRLLTTEEELAEAAHRAASFERRAANRATERAAQYEVMAESETASPSDATVRDIAQRSAS